MSPSPSDYRHHGVRALVVLHERHLRAFLDTWRRARTAGVQLPPTDDENYASLTTLLRHVLGEAGGYMQAMCDKLELTDPWIAPPPELDQIEAQAESYLEHVLARWRVALVDVDEETFYRPAFKSARGLVCSLEAMLQHALTHAMRHEFQLAALLETR